MTAVDRQWQWMKWPLHLIVFPPGKGRQGRRFQEHSNEDLWQQGDGKIKHRKGWPLNLIPCAIFIVVAIKCVDRALGKKQKWPHVFKLWLCSLLIFNVIRKSLENHHETWDYDQSIKHNDYSVCSFLASPWKWDLCRSSYVGETYEHFS